KVALEKATTALKAVKEVQDKTVENKKGLSLNLLRAKIVSHEARIKTLQERYASLERLYSDNIFKKSDSDYRERFRLQDEMSTLNYEIGVLHDDIKKWNLEINDIEGVKAKMEQGQANQIQPAVKSGS
ncbi:MAG: hypothetical protein R3240_08390, partial [Gammaproteobacteria bacterium]|nr:hypothetical protein [Gammaproteobacteria bacterium]